MKLRSLCLTALLKLIWVKLEVVPSLALGSDHKIPMVMVVIKRKGMIN